MLTKQVKMTSFIKVKVTTSPLAMDDSYLAEEFLTFDLSGIDDYLQIRIADLLANDKGGAATTFHSVDATTSDGVPIIYDQTAQALLFDATAYQGLAEGASSEVTFKYMIQLGNGKLSEALVTFHVIGENEGPAANDMTLAATEHQALADISFQADDVDSDDDQASLTYQVVDDPAHGTITLNGNKFSFDPGTAFDGLAKDEVGSVTFTYTATDRHGAASEAKTITIAVIGENDAPVAQASSASGYEDMPITASFAADDVDSDDGQASLTYEIVDQPDSGAVTVNADGTFTFDPNGDFDHLSAGQEAQVTFTYRAVDRHGAASSAETVTLTIQGKGNTPAMISGDLFSPDLLIEDSGNYFTFGQLIVTDPDPGEAGFQDVDPADLVGQYGTFTFDNGAWTYTLDNEAAQSLPTGEGPEDHLVVTSIDGTASAVIRARIKGENDPATFTGTDSVSFMENETEARGGTLGLNDVDTGQNHWGVLVYGKLSFHGTHIVTAKYGTFSISPETDSWTYTVNQDAVHHLNAGDTVTDQFQAWSYDTSATKVITATIHGVDDPHINFVRDHMFINDQGLVGTAGEADYFIFGLTDRWWWHRGPEYIVGFESGLDKIVILNSNPEPQTGYIDSFSFDYGYGGAAPDGIVYLDSVMSPLYVQDAVVQASDIIVRPDDPYPNNFPMVSVSGGGIITEGDHATFSFHRTGDLSGELVVHATTVFGSRDIVFAAGESTATFQYATDDDDVAQGIRFSDVEIAIDDPNYLTFESSASVVIKDNEELPPGSVIRDDQTIPNEGLVGTAGQVDYFVVTRLPDIRNELYAEQIIGFESGVDKVVVIDPQPNHWSAFSIISYTGGDPNIFDTSVLLPGFIDASEAITAIDVDLQPGDVLLYHDETLLPPAPSASSDFLLA